MTPLTIKTISRCNQLFSVKTLHPTVSLIPLGGCMSLSQPLRLGFHAVWLTTGGGGSPVFFGRREYDFSDGMLVASLPGQLVDSDWWNGCNGAEGWLLCFHPSWIRLLKGGREAGAHSFFRYRPDEALHLSLRECAALFREMDGLEEELRWGIDECSRAILGDRMGLLLDYVARFYKRQFITRREVEADWLGATDTWLEQFFRSGQARYSALPTAETLAARAGCSPAYFDDALRQATGKDTRNYVNAKRIALAESLLQQGRLSVEEVAETLGFPTGHDFCTVFRRLRGEMPGMPCCCREMGILN
ncbi:helix-turn-helix domain-containing protein [Barnesiella viscericola]|uniref:helix-turn-helix domain-containing protein n=1 Tax=Barnesiella viscericola TaxID=397865 RepID=UPI0024B86DBA|nr:AraC family transcriptional regulator [Barnesiella viscericola]